MPYGEPMNGGQQQWPQNDGGDGGYGGAPDGYIGQTQAGYPGGGGDGGYPGGGGYAGGGDSGYRRGGGNYTQTDISPDQNKIGHPACLYCGMFTHDKEECPENPHKKDLHTHVHEKMKDDVPKGNYGEKEADRDMAFATLELDSSIKTVRLGSMDRVNDEDGTVSYQAGLLCQDGAKHANLPLSTCLDLCDRQAVGTSAMWHDAFCNATLRAHFR